MKPKVIVAAIASCILVLAGYFVLSLAWSDQTGKDMESSPARGVATKPSLGLAETFAVLGASAVTSTGPTYITGDLGISPNLASSITHTGIFEVTGTIYAGAVDPDPTATQAQLDVTTAYNNLAGQTGCTKITQLAGQILPPGVYCSEPDSSMDLSIGGTLTLDAQGDPNAVWVFQIGSTLTCNPGSSVLVINGGQACNVFWQVGSSATLNTTTTFVGNILAYASITLNTGASMSGRALARTGAVTLDTNDVTVAVCAATPTATPTGPTPTPTATPTPSACDEPVLSLSAQVVSPGQELKFFGCIPAFGGQAVDVYLVLRSPTGVVFSAIPPDGIAPGINPYARGIINPRNCQCRDLLTHLVCANAETGVWTAFLAVLPAGAAPKAKNAIAIATTTVVVKG